MDQSLIHYISGHWWRNSHEKRLGYRMRVLSLAKAKWSWFPGHSESEISRTNFGIKPKRKKRCFTTLNFQKQYLPLLKDLV
jgi:hypothetical protein